MSNIFISYSHKDAEYVHKLQLAMTEHGLDAWVDDRINYGSNWPDEIERRLKECSAFVLVMSTYSKESFWVSNELQTAIQLQKPIFSLMLSGEIWWLLQTTQSMDVRDGSLPSENFFLSLARIQGAAEIRAAARNEAPKIENINIQISGDVSGNIIFGNDNAAATGADARAQMDRGTPEHLPATGSDLPLPVPEPAPAADPPQLPVKSSPTTIQKILTQIDTISTRIVERIPSRLIDRLPAPLAKNIRSFVPVLALVGACMFALIFSLALPSKKVDEVPSSSTPTMTSTAPSKTPTPQATAINTATPTAFPTEITQKDASMLLIASGSFTMGSEHGGNSDERPLHDVTLTTFYIDKYEVSNALYKACVDTHSCSRPSKSSSFTQPSYYGNKNFDNYPVIFVNWQQAKTYCEWRGARLPSEAEWEYAARATTGHIYPWGDEIDKNHANYAGVDTVPVDSYENNTSAFGLYNMAGNVLEWVNDFYNSGYYENSSLVNPRGPATGKSRVTRGGGWNNNSVSQRAAGRFSVNPILQANYLGFRCAMTP